MPFAENMHGGHGLEELSQAAQERPVWRRRALAKQQEVRRRKQTKRAHALLQREMERELEADRAAMEQVEQSSSDCESSPSSWNSNSVESESSSDSAVTATSDAKMAPLSHATNRLGSRQDALALKRAEREKRRREQEALERRDRTDSDMSLEDETEEEAGASTEAFINDEGEDSESCASYNLVDPTPKAVTKSEAAPQEVPTPDTGGTPYDAA